MLDIIFPNLISKTFFLLFLSLIFTFIGAYAVVLYFRHAYKQKKKYVTATKNKEGELDIHVAPGVINRLIWPIIILDFAAFFYLMFIQNLFPTNILIMFLYTFITGIMLGIVLIAVDENMAMKVAWLTAIITLLAGVIGMYSSIDFSFMGTFLFFALIGLILVNFIRVFISIRGTARRVVALIGILIFVGYLLFDFGNLRKAKMIQALNNWSTALNFSINIYLDIINLFLEILDALSED
jgi:hypothetical protein